MIVALQHHVLELVEAGHAPGEAHGVHVVEAKVQQGPGSSGDAVALAGDIMRRLKVDFTITEKAPTTRAFSWLLIESIYYCFHI